MKIPRFLILGVIIFLILLVLAGLWAVSRPSQQLTSGEQLGTQMALSTPIITPTPIMMPTATPEKPIGPVWVVSKIEEEAIHSHGFTYDVAIFTNLDSPSVSLRAQCSAPGWPSPEIGQQYTINEYRVMIPIEGVYSPLQRFWVLE